MLSLLTRIVLIALLTVTVAGCAAIAGIFKAGFWTGLIVAAIVIVLIAVLVGRK